jgi:hypothetical protein
MDQPFRTRGVVVSLDPTPVRLERDVNAARNIRDEGICLLNNEVSTVAGHQLETLDAVSRDHETKPLRRGRGDRYQSRTTQPTLELSPLS